MDRNDATLRRLTENGQGERASIARSVALRPQGIPYGALLWDFLVSFVSARRTFVGIHQRYEARVRDASRRMGVGREALVLPPRELFELFDLRRLKFLKEQRLRGLRDLAEQVFAESEDEVLLDVYCSHIYHELSILAEEHRSVGRFLRIRDHRRYRQLFDEVSGYYPKRLQRIRRLFTGGLRRIENVLPTWVEHREIVRGVYLFGDRLARLAYDKDISALYRRMYPNGGDVLGYLAAARSFAGSSFMILAREAAQCSVDAGERLLGRRHLERAEEHALEEARDFLVRLDGEAGVPSEVAERANGHDRP
jgi:hypothetical protein